MTAGAPLALYCHPLASFCWKVPFSDTHANLAACLQRLQRRPSFARVIEEAGPYFAMFPE